MMKVVLCGVLVTLAVVNSQCAWSTDNEMAVVGGGRWRYYDFPKNTTTQNFAELNATTGWLNSYTYIPNTVPAGLNMYNTQWLTLTQATKLAERPRVRPVGYKYAEITPYNAKVPCVRIEGVAGFGVEIMIYALVDVEVCIRHKYEASSLNAQSAQLFNDICGQQRLQHCFIAPDYYNAAGRPSYFDYEIYVRGTNPPDMTVPVFYRSRHSEFSYQQQGSQFSSGNTEMWCMMISGSVETSYPEFASVVPPNIRIPATNAAGSLRVNFISFLIAVLATCLFIGA